MFTEMICANSLDRSLQYEVNNLRSKFRQLAAVARVFCAVTCSSLRLYVFFLWSNVILSIRCNTFGLRVAFINMPLQTVLEASFHLQ